MSGGYVGTLASFKFMICVVLPNDAMCVYSLCVCVVFCFYSDCLGGLSVLVRNSSH